jgi:hypothetical protein
VLIRPLECVVDYVTGLNASLNRVLATPLTKSQRSLLVTVLMGLGASVSLGILGFLTQNNVNLILIILCFSFITTLLHQRKTKNLNKLDASIA